MTHLNGIVAVCTWMATVLGSALLARRLLPDQRELSRKLVHIGTGAVIPIAWWFAIPAVLAIPFAVTVTLMTAINHQWRFVPAVEDVDRNSYGTIAYGIAITTLLVLFWPERADAVCSGVMVMAIGDGLAGLIGRAVSSPRWQLMGQTKSLAGTCTMAAASLTVLFSVTVCTGIPLPWSNLVVLAAVATALEQLSPAGIDNLTVPLATGLIWASSSS